MKDIIEYYYDLDVLELEETQNYTSFNCNGDTFYFVFYNRTKEELNDLINICLELKSKNFKVHDIIFNRFNSPLTMVADKNYILLKLNCNKDDIISFVDIVNNSHKLRLNGKNSNLYRNNWGLLWSRKIDYFEYQIKEMGHDKKLVLDTFSYYIGLAENAISYVNKVNKLIRSNYENVTLSHRRIFIPNKGLNYYNPISFIFDLEVRDIAEMIKAEFFVGEDSFQDLCVYLKMHKLTNYSYHMLYGRLVYPSYYFDVYDNIMNNDCNEELLIPIIEKIPDYEQFLKMAYNEINRYTPLERIDWLLK